MGAESFSLTHASPQLYEGTILARAALNKYHALNPGLYVEMSEQ